MSTCLPTSKRFLKGKSSQKFSKGKYWKLTSDGKLINMVLNESWKYGSKSWSMEDGYIIEKSSKQVMDTEFEWNLNGISPCNFALLGSFTLMSKISVAVNDLTLIKLPLAAKILLLFGGGFIGTCVQSLQGKPV